MKYSITVVALAAMMVLPVTAHAEDTYPDQPITWVNPFKPGGGTDHFLRAIEPITEDYFGETATIEYRDGGSGLVAWRHMLDEPADGYTVLAEVTSGVSASLKEASPPVTPDDARILGRYGVVRLIFVASQDAPYADWAGFVAYANENPGTVSVGGAEVVLLAGASVFEEVGVDVNFIPYPGTGPATTDLLGGHIDAVLVATGSIPNLQDRSKIIANISNVDLSDAQKESVGEVYWVREAGLEGFGLPRYWAVHPDTPEDVYEALLARTIEMMSDPSVNERLLAIGEQVDFLGGAEAQAEYERFVEAARRSIASN